MPHQSKLTFKQYVPPLQSSFCYWIKHCRKALEGTWTSRHSFCPKGICFFRRAKSRAGNKGYEAPPDASVHPKYWLMKIFKVMTATSSSNPPQNHQESCISLYKIDDLLDNIDRSRLKWDVFQPDRLNIFVGNLDWRCLCANSQSVLQWEHPGNEAVGEVGFAIPYPGFT